MKNKSLFISILLILAAFVSLGAALSWYGVISYDSVTGELTFSKPSVFSSSVSMGLPHLVQAATDTLTAAECKGYVITNYGQSAENTQTLPAAASGLNGIIVLATAGAGDFHLKAGAGDKIYLSGTALDDADKVSTTPVAGTYFTFFAFQTGASAWDWIVIPGPNCTLSDGGA